MIARSFSKDNCSSLISSSYTIDLKSNSLPNTVAKSVKKYQTNSIRKYSQITSDLVSVIGSTLPKENVIFFDIKHDNDKDFLNTNFKKIYELCNKKDVYGAIDIIYKNIELLLHNNIKLCNDYIEKIKLSRLLPEVQISLLTITFPAKEKLVSRPKIMNEISNHLKEQGENPDEVLFGLQ